MSWLAWLLGYVSIGSAMSGLAYLSLRHQRAEGRPDRRAEGAIERNGLLRLSLTVVVLWPVVLWAYLRNRSRL